MWDCGSRGGACPPPRMMWLMSVGSTSGNGSWAAFLAQWSTLLPRLLSVCSSSLQACLRSRWPTIHLMGMGSCCVCLNMYSCVCVGTLSMWLRLAPLYHRLVV